MAKKPKTPKLPERTRRLTKAELAKLGLAPGSKRRVNADLKRVTKRTKTFSERQWIQAKTGETREEHAITIRTQFFKQGGKSGKGSKHIKNLTRREFMRQLKKSRGKRVMIQLKGQPSKAGARYQTGGDVWVTSDWVDADELLENEAFLERIIERLGFGEDNPPKKFGLIVDNG